MTVARLQLVIVVIVAAALLALALMALSSPGSPVAPLPSAHAAGKGDPKDCDDFKTQKKAQKWFKKHHPRRDPAGLDADNDGIACEDLPCPCKPKATAARSYHVAKARKCYAGSATIIDRSHVKCRKARRVYSQFHHGDGTPGSWECSNISQNCAGGRRGGYFGWTYY